MIDADKNRRAFVEKLARENREFYGTQDGRGTLRAFELTFEHRWIYLFELVQNALDAGARSIALRLAEDGGALIFQHDGKLPLDEKDIEGLSKIFRSTKGASSVGFMGVGFKSVFGRFREARISGWDWKFRYKIDQIVGKEYGDVQLDLLGAVVPIWDDAIAAPDPGFTTRFEMRRLANAGADLKSDLGYFLPDRDRTPLAILAASGLERLEVNGRVWELSVSEEPDGSLEATAVSAGEDRRWQLFPVRFKPSREAIARFLEHRRIQPSEDERERVYAEAARPRRVLGVLPLDNDGSPAPPKRGRVYAALPTEITLPFGLHINADWLLNISRTGLREIEENPWQRDIADRIADVLAGFLKWVARSRLYSDAAGKAFSALALPSSDDANRLEMLLAEDRWLSRLRDRLEDAAVIPAWIKQVGSWTFAKPSEIVVPPAPLAEAFKQQPALQPAVLMKGFVLRGEVLGTNAYELLKRIGLLTEMSPQELEQSWNGGLEYWWESLAQGDSDRRGLLFRLWSAVAELVSQARWQAVDLPCVRTTAGVWIPVNKAAFFSERLPTENEPGGPEALRFIQSFFPDRGTLIPGAWISELRRGAAKDGWRGGPLSRAWEWIENNGHSIKLRTVVKAAAKALATSPNPDWQVLVPLGRWALHRKRPDLLTHVLVESKNGLKGMPVNKALLADPYVEHGRSRQILFPAMLPISAAYVQQAPTDLHTHDWREFFEKAGAQGGLKVVQSAEKQVHSWEYASIAEFLGLDPDEINERIRGAHTSKLLDFDIDPGLPGPDSSDEVRAALAPWLEDGFSALSNGCRKAEHKDSYHRYSSHFSSSGKQLSAWAARLSELAWVPCGDGKLRLPKDVLPERDPTREEAPAARLSSDLISALNREGVKFGAAIPKAAPLRKLLKLGSRLDAERLANLLRECREQIETAEDSRRFELAVRQLTVPSRDGGRIPPDRIVQRIGGRFRGSLGGWILPLERVDEALRKELEHLKFKFPENTTGEQALAYIRDIWTRARSSPERLANEVRDVLPTAYAYCLEDMDNDDSLAKRWKYTLPQAAVFSEREWVFPAETDIYFDDIEDRRFFPGQAKLRTATGGHLGDSLKQRRRAADALGLKPLSSTVEMEWSEGDEQAVDDWIHRFEIICRLLRHVRSSGQAEGNGAAGTGGREWRLRRVESLHLAVSVEGAPSESVPVHARLHEGSLTVAGRPVQFGADAAKELLRTLSFSRRADLSADLTAMLTAIDDASDFALAADKFRRSCAPDFVLPDWVRQLLGAPATASSDSPKAERETAVEPGLSQPSPDTGSESQETEREAAVVPGSPQPRSDPLEPEAEAVAKPWTPQPSADARSDSASNLGLPDGVPHEAPEKASDAGDEKPRETESKSMPSNETGRADAPREKTRDPSTGGGSYDRKRALGQSRAAVQRALTGEIAPSGGQDGDASEGLGDEIYRKAAAQYEKEQGRKPELGEPHQAGWDLHSVDPQTGEERLIEVKGKSRPWTENEVVELSGAQARKAWQTAAGWYLYVVERTDDDSFNVLPIENPVRNAGKWMLCGQPWRDAAEKPQRITAL